MKKLENLLNKYSLIVVLILTIPAVVSLLVPGFYGASDEVHIGWLYEMDRVVKSYKFPPRFVPDLSYGFGYPLFNFVFPLPFYIAEVFHLMGVSLVDSIKLLFLISVPISAIFIYLFLKEYTTKVLAILGAVLYSYGPYRAVDIYIRGAIGEILAFVFLPLIMLAIKKIIDSEKKDSIRWVGIGGLSLACLVLSHNIATYMFVPFAILFAILKLFFKKGENGLRVLMMFIFGLVLSSYFWLPALVESSFMKYDTVFNFIDHFPTLKQLFTPYWGYGASVPGPYDGMSFFMGYSQIFVLITGVGGVFYFWKKIDRTNREILIWSFISLIIVFFMMNFRSTIVWKNLPLIAYFQFPWRFLMMTTFLVPIFVIVLKQFKYNFQISLALIVLTILINQNYFKPQDFLGRTDEYFLKKYIPYPSVDMLYTQNQEEYLRLPKTTQTRPDKKYPLIYSESGVKVGNITQINSLDVFFNTTSEKAEEIFYSKYFFPGWEASIDNQKVEIKEGKPFGQISLLVPKGEHKVEIVFRETAFRMWLNIISLIAFILALVICLKPKLIKR